MRHHIKATLEELQWKDIRHEVSQKNPELAKVIDDIDPGPEYTLFKASYPYGSEILKNGYLYLPNGSGGLSHINSAEIATRIREQLNYNLNSNPVTFFLKNSAEIFMEVKNITIPFYGALIPGRVLGTWRVLNPESTQHPIFIWNMTAGARSIFMLPKISETAGYNRLRRAFHLHVDKPRAYFQHWELFKEIANHPDFGESWTAELLFFSKKWFEQLDDQKWLPFKTYLLATAWEGIEFFRNQFIWNLTFSLIQKKRGIKPDPYAADTVKHLLAMGVGALPGFAAAIDDSVAPVRKLQEIFETVYRLEEYAPIIMYPSFFSLEKKNTVYYSLQYPTIIEFSPKSRKQSTKISDLYDIKQLLFKYLNDLHTNTLNVSGTKIYELYDKVNYEFFHTTPGNYSGIRHSKDLPAEDVSFLQNIDGKPQKFAANSAFIRGCIRISAK